MKILLCIRNDYYRSFAGDSMQVIKTAEYLGRKGLQVEINNGGIIDYSSYDIVHLFNLTRIGDAYKYYKIAKSYKKVIVMTSSYWNLKRYYEYIQDYEGVKLWDKCKPYRMEILKGCKMIYVNSEMEAKLLKSDFGEGINYKIIYNGVETEREDIPLYNLKERFNLNNYILCVGKICNMKNQLTLAKICNELGRQLVLIGSVDDKSYFNECIQFKNVMYLGFMDSYNIYNAYRFAKVHVLPSFVENPGLSNLEAAAAGCNIVSTSEGTSKEYFKEMALYCNPYNEEDIALAVEKGFKQRKNSYLKNHILQNYNWEKCINALYEYYKKILL
ncbi:glycosyltransferase family 4 protein [Clostridium magnum]|uniref:Glycosyl transferases group 1 n=1 Tax=Clostridium magnum DSM 2767 TaxID=1121326 RepID=A0A161YRR1_9CLOT|nr:glycosyltransferase family 4 protein [Clostridium magnum]KZL93672.1 glycosyl transferases group 1 [Clostridium magnum DSM 2767]SHI92810.1 Glycosyltransferase involved in cell wall bisynthesis [Clostridium magnum DSM 2767]